MKKGITIYFLIAVFSLAGGVGHAGPLTIPNTFVSGAKAKAAEINANFQAVKNAIDNNDARISAIQLGYAWNSSDVNITINATDCNVLSITIVADADGIVLVTGAGFFTVTHVLGIADAPRASLSTVSGQMNFGTYFTLVEIPKDLPSGVYGFPFSITGGFNVAQGSNTIHMVADVFDGTDKGQNYSASQTIGRRQLTGILMRR